MGVSITKLLSYGIRRGHLKAVLESCPSIHPLEKLSDVEGEKGKLVRTMLLKEPLSVDMMMMMMMMMVMITIIIIIITIIIIMIMIMKLYLFLNTVVNLPT